MKIWALKFHRWVALTFALPLVFVLCTGLILSFEPWLVTRAITPGALTASKIEALLSQHDQDGKARSLVYRSYDGTLTISAGRGGGTVVDVASGQELAGPSSLANLLTTARRMHERLLIDAGWLVIASSVVMLVLAILGILMGLPRFANTLSGWHKAMAWCVLPLIVLSPLTGLLLASNTFMSAPPAATSVRGAPLRLADAVRIVGEQHDLSTLVWIRPQGGRLLTRLVERGEYRVYAVAPDGMTAMPRNWPRLWHEGNFAGAWSALLNLIASVAMIGLLVTGPLIWLRRRLRLQARRLPQVAPAE
jgi:uncharacterized iron-regulated membrane protein